MLVLPGLSYTQQLSLYSFTDCGIKDNVTTSISCLVPDAPGLQSLMAHGCMLRKPEQPTPSQSYNA